MDLNAETRTAWEQKAAFWDNLMGETGNLFQKLMIGPASERLLNIQPGETILDLACGNGVMARWLVQLGAKVTAVDFSVPLIELARFREYSREIDYRVVDATDEHALLTLGKFDAVVCNMALMDIADITPTLRAVRQMLTPETGRFVFTVMHPCFSNNTVRMGVEQEDRDGNLIDTYFLKITDYLNVPPQKGMGAVGEPAPHYYFHRPLHVLLNMCFQTGFVMDGIEEPVFDDNETGKRILTWRNFKNFPPIIAVRMRPQKRNNH